MAITINLPPEIEQQLEAEWNGDLPRKVLEAIAVEGYRQGALSRGQVGELLGMNFWETEAFLKERNAYLHYSMEDLEKDRATLERLLKK
jgi:predicted HTH domain antitoxin